MTPDNPNSVAATPTRRRKEFANFRNSDVMGGVELLQASFHNHQFSRHSHETFMLGVIEDGAQGFYHCGSNHIAPTGNIILVNADDVHTGYAETQGGWAYQGMYPSNEQLSALNSELCQNSSSGGIPYFPQPVVQDPELANALRFCMAANDDQGSRLQRESLLYDALSQLIIRHARTRPGHNDGRNPQRQLMLVKEFLDDFADADISLEELAKLAALSPYHLSRSFKKQFGLPPHAYQVQARLRKARTLLRSGMNISEVAIDCGFHDQSHLHRHFRKAMGITPRQYQSAF